MRIKIIFKEIFVSLKLKKKSFYNLKKLFIFNSYKIVDLIFIFSIRLNLNLISYYYKLNL